MERVKSPYDRWTTRDVVHKGTGAESDDKDTVGRVVDETGGRVDTIKPGDDNTELQAPKTDSKVRLWLGSKFASPRDRDLGLFRPLAQPRAAGRPRHKQLPSVLVSHPGPPLLS